MPARLFPFGQRSRTMKFWLACLVAGCILPAALVAGFLIVGSYQRERATLERDMIATARALMQAVDADIDSFQSTLRVLAASSHLQSGDLKSFYDELQALVPGHTASNFVLHRPDGQQLLNTMRPYGTPLPREPDPVMIREALRTGNPVVSNLFRGPATGRLVMGTSMPVRVDGEIRYMIGMGMFADRLAEVLKRQKIPAGWVVSIIDRQGTIGAMTAGPTALVGSKAADEFLAETVGRDEGTFTLVHHAREGAGGEPLFGGFSRSPRTGWMIAMAAPIAVVTTGLKYALLINVALAIVLLLAAALLARHIVGRVTRSLAALTGPALALGSGVREPVPPVEIAEVDTLGRAIARAGMLLEAREGERDAAELRERRMHRLKQSADAANRAKSEFLALMSHELRTPMNSILGFAELLQKSHYGPLTDKQKEFAALIVASGTHLLALINDILDLSKIEAGRLAVTLESVELEPVLRALAATLKPIAAPANVAVLARDFGADLPAVRADRVRLAQVLLNLGTNAIKYNRPGGTVRLACELHAQTGASDGTDHVRIAFTDTGHGIPEERQAELFQLFSRLGAEDHAVEGTGIGLALSRRLIELMGGSIGFTSTAGEGSCFWIDVPVDRGAAARAPAEAEVVAARAVAVD